MSGFWYLIKGNKKIGRKSYWETITENEWKQTSILLLVMKNMEKPQ